MKCNVCGKVFCYTDEDLKKNTSNAGMAALSAIGGIASALGGGTVFHTHHLQGQSDRYNDKVIDYSQCPYCHSRSLSAFTGNAEEDTKVVKTVNINTSASTESLLKRVFIFLEDGEWETADAYCEACLDKDPESAKAYLGKLMAELHVKIQEDLKHQQKPFDSNTNYQKAIRYGDADLRNTLVGYTEYINNRNENARKDKILGDAKAKMTGASVSNYDEALSLFASIPGWKDADEQTSICISKIAELKAKEAAEQAMRKKNFKIATILCVCFAIIVACFSIIISKKSAAAAEAKAVADKAKADAIVDALIGTSWLCTKYGINEYNGNPTAYEYTYTFLDENKFESYYEWGVTGPGSNILKWEFAGLSENDPQCAYIEFYDKILGEDHLYNRAEIIFWEANGTIEVEFVDSKLDSIADKNPQKYYTWNRIE